MEAELLGGPIDGARVTVRPDDTRVMAHFAAGPVIYARTCLKTRHGRPVFRDSRLPS